MLDDNPGLGVFTSAGNAYPGINIPDSNRENLNMSTLPAHISQKMVNVGSRVDEIQVLFDNELLNKFDRTPKVIPSLNAVGIQTVLPYQDSNTPNDQSLIIGAV